MPARNEERHVPAAREFVLRVCDCDFFVGADAATAPLVELAFGRLFVSSDARPTPRTRYRVSRDSSRGVFRVQGPDGSDVSVNSEDALLFHLDKEIIVTAQHLRPDLLFLHAAVVGINGRIAALAAPSGTGKSTLTLALLARGAGYLSDELAPIDLATWCVHAFPHALCLKGPPPPPWQLPDGTVRAGRLLYAPVPARIGDVPVPKLSAFFFLRRDGVGVATTPSATPTGVPVSAATAAAHVLSNALNMLAHAGHGLEAALALGRAIPAFELNTTDLERACAVVETALQTLPLD